MDEKVIKIEKLVFGGKGLSRDLEKVTFVPLTLPGEKVRVRLTKEHSDYQEAVAIDIVEPSPDRVAPECSYFGVCGGCQLSHTKYETQVRLKIGILQETLQRNDLRFPEIQVITGKPFGYRHRAQLKYDALNKRLGFFEANSNRVIDIQECICLTPGLNDLLKALRAKVCSQSFPALREIECYENDQQEHAAFFSPPIQQFSSLENQELSISFRGNRYPMNPKVFLQVNPGMWRAMIQEVESHYEGRTLKNALELYCGAGFFTAPLAYRFQRMTACEENPQAIHHAKTLTGLKNVEWICARVENYRFPPELDAVIVDPPRPGLHQNVLRQLIDRKPDWISYVSCDCTTFARDAKKLMQFYTIEKMTLLDLFPQTYHFETIALLRKFLKRKPPD
jgi:23S rRNA (uracil1939-C5)-methyltransferase